MNLFLLSIAILTLTSRSNMLWEIDSIVLFSILRYSILVQLSRESGKQLSRLYFTLSFFSSVKWPMLAGRCESELCEMSNWVRLAQRVISSGMLDIWLLVRVNEHRLDSSPISAGTVVSLL